MSVPTNLLSANVESVETDTSGWTAGANTTLFQSSRFYQGAKSLGMTATAAGSVTATTATRVAVTAGTVYQAYAYFAGVTAIAGRTSTVRIDWYAASTGGSPISSSTGAATTLTNDTAWNTPPPQVTATAPAGAAYAALTVTVTGLTAGAQVAADRFTLGLPNHTPALNLLPYTASSVETDASEWTALANTTVSRTQPLAFDGWYNLTLTSAAAGTVGASSVSVPVTPGTTYLLQVVAQSSAGPIRVDIQWLDGSGTLLSTTTGRPWTLNTATWTACGTVGIAPAGAVTARMVLAATATAGGQVWNCDYMRFNIATSLMVAGNLIGFDDSDFEGGISPAWTVTGGTASLLTSGAYFANYGLNVAASGGDLTISLAFTPSAPIVPGASYQMRIPTKTPTVAPGFRSQIEWLNASGSAIRTRWQTWTVSDNSVWYWGSMGDIAPAGAVSVRVSLVYSGLAPATPVYIDRAQFLTGGLTVSAVEAEGGGALITVNGLSIRSPSWLWTLTRLDSSGTSYPVRGWADDLTAQTITGDTAVITDYETPLGVPVQWRAAIKNPSGAGYQDYLSDPLTLDYTPTEVWLKDPGLPQRNVRLVVQTPMPTWKRPARQGVNTVHGRTLPVVISDVRGGKTGDLTVVTETEEDRRDLDWVLSSGGTLLLQWPPGWGEEDMYVSIGDISAAPVVDYAEFSDRTWILPLTQVDRPIGGVSGDAARTWTTVKTSGATWADVLGGVKSWLTIRLGTGA
jgi:hypothetical protein